MDAETKMWLDLMRGANPQWKLAPGRNFKQALGQGVLTNDSYVYVVDTSTGWIAAAAMPSSELARLRGLVEAKPEAARQAREACASVILDAGAQDLSSDSPDAERCVVLAVCALAQTRTWEHVRSATRSLAGHWAYVAYKPRQGPAAFGRPAWKGSSTPGFLSVDELDRFVGEMLKVDTSAETNVGRQLAEEGGADLCAGFERLRRGERG